MNQRQMSDQSSSRIWNLYVGRSWTAKGAFVCEAGAYPITATSIQTGTGQNPLALKQPHAP